MNRITLERDGCKVVIESVNADLTAEDVAWALYDAMSGFGYAQKSVLQAWGRVVDELVPALYE